MTYLSTAIGLPPDGSSTVQYSTVEYSTVRYGTVRYGTVQYGTVQYSRVQYSTVHIYTQTVHRTTELMWKSAGRAPSWLVIPWHLPYS